MCFIRRGVGHGFKNLHAAKARALAVVTPGLIGPDYFREMAAVVNVAAPVGGLEAAIESVAGDRPAVTRAFQPTENGWVLTLDALPPGTYRAEVRSTTGGGGEPPPVHDVFQVM